jgi:hypothetical protein
VRETYSKHGVVFLGVPADEEEAPVRQAIARLGIPWDHLFDGRGSRAAVERLQRRRDAELLRVRP